MRILAINGAYRHNGITDQTVNAMVEMAKSAGAEVEVIQLRNYPLEFCLNCRECTQLPGESPGKCVQQDSFHDLVAKIENVDAYILASPTNFGSVTAIFKRFIERLIVYAYWPWGMKAPQVRKVTSRKKKAILISSCAAPSILGRLSYYTFKQLKQAAKTIGADTVATIFTGQIAQQPTPVLPDSVLQNAKKAVAKLI